MFLYATLVVLTLMKEREIRPLLTLKEQSFLFSFNIYSFHFFQMLLSYSEIGTKSITKITFYAFSFANSGIYIILRTSSIRMLIQL